MNSICPGGNRIWPKIGYWKLNESDLTTMPIECAPPSEKRCLGWNGIQSETLCGLGYLKSNYLCKHSYATGGKADRMVLENTLASLVFL